MRYWIILSLYLITCINLGICQEEEKFSLDFPDTELETFIKTIARITNKRILYDPTIKGRKINLISPERVTRKELYKIFLSVMEYNGYILETTGKPGTSSELIKIKRNIQGPWTQTKTIYKEEELRKIEDQDQFVTMVIKLKFIAAREVQTTLRALRIVNPQGGNLAGIDGSNTILVTDFAPNVKRIYEVIQLMDQEGPQKQFKLIKLKYANAEDVVEKLKELVQDTTRRRITSGPNLDEFKISADKRLNAVMVQAYPAKLKQVDALIHELDQQLAEEPGKIHYIQLNHADASKLQKTLEKLVEGGKLVNNTSIISSRIRSNTSQEKMKTAIQAEPQTNSLIVKAEQTEWEEIRRIIKKVDVRRPQVLIEGAIIEISPEDVLGLGVELFWAESSSDKTNFVGGSDFGLSNLVTVDDTGEAKPLDPTNLPSTLDVDKYGKIPVPTRTDFSRASTAAITYKDNFTIPMLLKAVQKQGDFKVLSIPRILTNDHEKAQIKVSDQAPSDVTQTTSSGDNLISSGKYQEAGTVLNITPHISGEKNYLRLDIDQVIEEFDYSRVSRAGLPSKRSRKIVTSVTVPDGHTIAIGGLTFDSENEQIEKVPLLGDLPIIGFFFQTRVVTYTKRNIYLFVTPHIFRDKDFKDLHKHSRDFKLDAQKLGANIEMIDKSFARYQNKYEVSQDGLEPMYILEYKSPNDKNQENK